MKQLNFIETVYTEKLSNHLSLVLQTYSGEDDKLIYNVSLEKDPYELISTTTDLYETYDLEKAKGFFDNLMEIYQAGKYN